MHLSGNVQKTKMVVVVGHGVTTDCNHGNSNHGSGG